MLNNIHDYKIVYACVSKDTMSKLKIKYPNILFRNDDDLYAISHAEGLSIGRERDWLDWCLTKCDEVWYNKSNKSHRAIKLAKEKNIKLELIKY